MNLQLINIHLMNFYAAGLGEVQKNLVKDWIGPLFLIIVAGVAVTFAVKRQFRELAIFIGLAAVIGLLIFGGDMLFGESGIFKGIAQDFSTDIGEGGGAGGGAGGGDR